MGGFPGLTQVGLLIGAIRAAHAAPLLPCALGAYERLINLAPLVGISVLGLLRL